MYKADKNSDSMFVITVFTFATLVKSTAASCDPCDCDYPFVVCKGYDVKEFVMFEPDTEIRYLTYDLTLIDNLPILQPNEFTNLLSLTLIDNSLITCADVTGFGYYHPEIALTHDVPDCNGTATGTESASTSTTSESASSDDPTTATDDVTNARSSSTPIEKHDHKQLSVVAISFTVIGSVGLAVIIAVATIYVNIKYCRRHPRITRSPMSIVNPSYNRHLSESEV